MIYFIDTFNTPSSIQNNVIPLAEHIYQNNTWRAQRPRNEGSPVLIGRIHNRHEVFYEDDNQYPGKH